jgi:hypothetical protein
VVEVNGPCDRDDDGPLDADLDTTGNGPDLEQIARWVDAVWGNRPGWAALAYGGHPYRDANGKYQHRSFTPHFYRWPDQRNAVLNDVARELATGPVDIYVAPHLRRSRDRKKHTALPPLYLHTDVDGHVGDPELWALVDPIQVQSGTAGHLHGYVPLTRAQELGRWDVLQRALRDRLGGDTDSKISDSDVLRLPGTLNFKATVPPRGVEPGEPTPVVLLPGGGRLWEPEELAELLGVALNAPNPARNGHQPPLGPLAPVPVPQVLPRAVTAALERHQDNTDRSAVFQAVVSACCGATLSREGSFAVVSAHVPGAVEKYDGRLVAEFDRSWGKALGYWTEHGGLTHEAAEEIRQIYADDSAMREWLLGEDGSDTASGPVAATDDEIESFLASFTRYRDPQRLGRRIAWMRTESLLTHANHLVTEVLDGCYPAERAVAALITAYRKQGGTDPNTPRQILSAALGTVLSRKVST